MHEQEDAMSSSSRTRLKQTISSIVSTCAEYQSKIEQLFVNQNSKTISSKHHDLHIITNPKAVFNLLESNFIIAFKTQSLNSYYHFKTQIWTYIQLLIQSFTLNAKFIYEQAFIVVENNRREGIIPYLIKDIREGIKLLKQTNQKQKTQSNVQVQVQAQGNVKVQAQCKVQVQAQGNENEQNQRKVLKERSENENKVSISVLQDYLQKASGVYYSICGICSLKTCELKTISNNLTDFYYQNRLTTRLIQQSFKLLDAGLQERNIMPYIYFIDNHKNECIKVLFTNNKWPFHKGMTLFLWMHPFTTTEWTVLWLQTEDHNQIKLQVHNHNLILHCTHHHQDIPESQEIICPFPTNAKIMLGVELEVIHEGLFGGDRYQLNVNINGVTYKNISTKIPKFEATEFLTQFSLFNNFIGEVHSIVICNKEELSNYEALSEYSVNGVCREQDVWELIGDKVLKNQNIVCIFNSERYFQGLLLNYVSDRNHACFEGYISNVKYHKYDDKIIQIYLPFLYFLTLIKQKDQKWAYTFDIIIQHLLQIIAKKDFQSTHSILFLLYFIQINYYPLQQSTLSTLYALKPLPNQYLTLLLKYLDPHVLIQKGLTLNQNLENQVNPVEKIQLLFYLESAWVEKWNSLQGFDGWWSPTFFISQNDSIFSIKDYIYSSSKQSRVEWQVKNFVSKDYCKCIIEPIFMSPPYGKLTYYCEEYKKKSCVEQDFKLNLNFKKKNKFLICKKVSKSGLDKLRWKLLGDKQSELNEQKISIQQMQLKQCFESEVLFIDIITVIIGKVYISKDGFITFITKHTSKDYDHMCVKAFQNQKFIYVAIHIKDIKKIYKKRFNATFNALFIKTKDGRDFMLHFFMKNADKFLHCLENVVTIKKDAYQSYLESQMPIHWIDKNISNFQYLQWLNQIAGRNYSDITQYPVLPWSFIADQDHHLHEEDQQFRDLTKNMGKHGDEERINHFLQKYVSNSQEQLFNQYHFGTHYSSSAIIFNFLIRIRPFSIGALTLQSGKFDCADRIFYSYLGSWKNATSSPTDVRELIPELYTLPEMFMNKNNYDYGLTQTKERIDNVELPAWCHQNPYQFVINMRKKLESKYISHHIHSWIDLIYGYKQRGKDAIDNMNIYYPLTYQNSIDLDQVDQPDQKISFQTQIAHFGQNPSQIIGNNPHPMRMTVNLKWEGKLVSDGSELLIQKCILSKSSTKQEKYVYKSVLEGRNSILSVKFISNQQFLVLRKHEYYVFKILNKKSDFIWKEQDVPYQLESCEVSLNYKELTNLMPVVSIKGQIILIAGFFSGKVHLLFLKEKKFNRVFSFPMSTITALAYSEKYEMLYIGDNEGYLRVYKVCTESSKQISFEELSMITAHDLKINSISMSEKGNLLCTCSDDGTLGIYNLYSHEIFRRLRHPQGLAISFAYISTCPLYSIIFYAKENSLFYSYSINGQFLDSVQEKSGFIYNMSLLKSSDSSETLVYLNANRELFIEEIPFIKLKRKIKMKKDSSRISCFQCCLNSKIAIAGSEEGALQIIANPESY